VCRAVWRLGAEVRVAATMDEFLKRRWPWRDAPELCPGFAALGQKGEDEILLSWARSVVPSNPVGVFADIGANDGLTYSNTRRLLELGWRGVFVEPVAAMDPSGFLDQAQRAGRLEIVRKAVVGAGHQGDTIRMILSDDPMLSTTSSEWAELRHDKGEARRTVEVPVVAIDRVVRDAAAMRAGDAASMLVVSIDVEGQSVSLLSSLLAAGLPSFDHTAIVVEHWDHMGKPQYADAVTLAFEHGFVPIAANVENTVIARSLA